MTYIVMTHGRNNMFLFLVDRSQIKGKWWSYNCNDAMRFHKKSAAEIQANKLRFKTPEVITYQEAKELSNRNEANYDYEAQEHPFSSEALGQD